MLPPGLQEASWEGPLCGSVKLFCKSLEAAVSREEEPFAALIFPGFDSSAAWMGSGCVELCLGQLLRAQHSDPHEVKGWVFVHSRFQVLFEGLAVKFGLRVVRVCCSSTEREMQMYTRHCQVSQAFIWQITCWQAGPVSGLCSLYIIAIEPSMSIDLSICLSVYLSVCLSIYPSVRPCVIPSVCLFARPSVCLCTYLSIYLIVDLFACLSTYLSVYLYVYIYIYIRPSASLSIYLRIHPVSICLSICLSIVSQGSVLCSEVYGSMSDIEERQKPMPTVDPCQVNTARSRLGTLTGSNPCCDSHARGAFPLRKGSRVTRAAHASPIFQSCPQP